jgi:hypothetical protein
MFPRRQGTNFKLDVAIDDLLDRLVEEPFDPDKYAKMVTQLAQLHKLKEHYAPKRVSPDTLLIVTGNLIGIVLILGYERAGVITSKAIGFVQRLR